MCLLPKSPVTMPGWHGQACRLLQGPESQGGGLGDYVWWAAEHTQCNHSCFRRCRLFTVISVISGKIGSDLRAALPSLGWISWHGGLLRIRVTHPLWPLAPPHLGSRWIAPCHLHAHGWVTSRGKSGGACQEVKSRCLVLPLWPQAFLGSHLCLRGGWAVWKPACAAAWA